MNCGIISAARRRSSEVTQEFAADGATRPFHADATSPASFYSSSTQTTWIAREAWLGSSRLHRMATYNHSTHSWGPDRTCGSSDLADDDHGVPAIFRDASGFIHWFGGAHASPLRHFATASADNNDTWINKGNVNANNYSYPQPIFDGTNLFLFLRKRVANSPVQDTGVLLKSSSFSSGAITFAAEVSLIDWGSDSRWYSGPPADDGTYIHLLATKADGADTARRDIYHFRYEKSTGHVLNPDGTHTDSTFPINLTTSNSNYRIVTQSTNTTSNPTCCIDGSGNLHLCYIDGVAPNFDVKHQIYSGGSWSSPTTVVSLTNCYRLVALTLSPSSGSVELYYPDNSAGTFTRGGSTIAKRVYSGGSWGAAVTIATAANGIPLDEPSAVLNGSNELKAIFAECDTASLDSGAGGLLCYAFGSSLTGPAITSPDAQVALQLKFEGADAATVTYDESIYQPFNLVTFVGNAQIDTGDFKFGASSVLFDGSGDYLTLARSSGMAISIAGVDKTFEAWVKVSAYDTSNTQTVLDTRASGATAKGFTLGIDTSHKLTFVAWNSSGTSVINLLSTNTISSGSWTHVAATRSGTTWRIFINGNLEASGTESATPADSSDQLLNIGRSGVTATPRYFHGWIDMVRIKSGVAEWTASFTPSSTAYARP